MRGEIQIGGGVLSYFRSKRGRERTLIGRVDEDFAIHRLRNAEKRHVYDLWNIAKTPH